MNGVSDGLYYGLVLKVEPTGAKSRFAESGTYGKERSVQRRVCVWKEEERRGRKEGMRRVQL